MERTDILVIGGGPGGLACATRLARGGARVMLVERKPVIGPKICAGGITGRKRIASLPEELIEQKFFSQLVRTRRHFFRVEAEQPMMVTVNRERLGGWMAQIAEEAGVTLLTGTRVLELEEGRAVLTGVGESRRHLAFDLLVGADGSTSLVRRFLGLPTRAMGVGLNAMLPGQGGELLWHLDASLFGAGYAWIFPHGREFSLGAYCDQRIMPAVVLKQRLLIWARQQNLPLPAESIRAGRVNFDFRGLCFGRAWLVGDAAGLASGLTGEGIASALVSGQAVAEQILDAAAPVPELRRLIRRQHRHRLLVRLVGSSTPVCRLLMTCMLLALRFKLLDHRSMEMTD